MGTPPFWGATEPEVCARVAYRLIERHWRRWRYPPEAIAISLADLRRTLEWRGFEGLALYVAAYNLHISRGLHTKFIRATMIERARHGHTFRAVLLWGYKAHRHDPRVTNRGVRTAHSIGRD